jgi:ABC-type Fe3+ transport system permease subunit
MSEVGAPVALPRALVVIMWVLAALFNVVFVSFFALYSAAHDWAVDRSEATGAFEPSQLLPHDAALWLSAHAAIVLLVVLDAVGVAVALRIRRLRVNSSQ